MSPDNRNVARTPRAASRAVTRSFLQSRTLTRRSVASFFFAAHRVGAGVAQHLQDLLVGPIIAKVLAVDEDVRHAEDAVVGVRREALLKVLGGGELERLGLVAALARRDIS